MRFWQQWMKEIENYIWFSKSNNGKVLDANGYPIDTSPGILEQLEDSNVHYYTHFTTGLLEEFLMDIYFNRIAPGNRRTIHVFTGEYGMLLFNRAIEDLVQKNAFTLISSNWSPTQRTRSEYHNNAYSYGYQFVEYQAFNGTVIRVTHNPIFDDTTINLEIDPISGYPITSKMFVFLDFENDNADSNVVLVKKKGEMKIGYYVGLTGPNGPANKTIISHTGDWYKVIFHDRIGVVIKDVTRCGVLYPAVI